MVYCSISRKEVIYKNMILHRATNLKGEIRRVFSKIQSVIPFSSLSDATIIFDIGDFCIHFDSSSQ